MTKEEIIEFCEMKAELEAENEDIYEAIIKELEQLPSEDTEVIKISKGAVKARQGRYVIYDVEWLKKNFYTTEEKIYGQPKEPCEDCISRKVELDGLASIAKAKAKSDAQKALMGRVMFFTEQLPPVIPKYTDEEIDRAQAVEQAYIDKMVELAVTKEGVMVVYIRDENYEKNASECYSKEYVENWDIFNPKTRPWLRGSETEEYTKEYLWKFVGYEEGD